MVALIGKYVYWKLEILLMLQPISIVIALYLRIEARFNRECSLILCRGRLNRNVTDTKLFTQYIPGVKSCCVLSLFLKVPTR